MGPASGAAPDSSVYGTEHLAGECWRGRQKMAGLGGLAPSVLIVTGSAMRLLSYRPRKVTRGKCRVTSRASSRSSRATRHSILQRYGRRSRTCTCEARTGGAFTVRWNSCSPIRRERLMDRRVHGFVDSWIAGRRPQQLNLRTAPEQKWSPHPELHQAGSLTERAHR